MKSLWMLACVVGSFAACSSTPPAPPTLVALDDMRSPPHSCAYVCPSDGTCPEITKPYTCPALSPWNAIEHDDPCPTWDGTSYPKPTQGQCTANAPSGDAIAYAGPGSGHIVLADGRWLAPSGADSVFDDLPGGLASGLTLVPSTSLALTVDTGYDDHVVRLVDVSPCRQRNRSDAREACSSLAPETLNSDIAFVPPGSRLRRDGRRRRAGAHARHREKPLTRDDASNLPLPQATDGNGNPVNWYASGVAASPDGTKLVVSSVNTKTLLVFDVAAPDLQQLLGHRRSSASKRRSACGSIRTTRRARTSTCRSGKTTRRSKSTSRTRRRRRSPQSFATEKDPEGIAFLDARFFVVGNDLGDSLTIVDRTSGTTTQRRRPTRA